MGLAARDPCQLAKRKVQRMYFSASSIREIYCHSTLHVLLERDCASDRH